MPKLKNYGKGKRINIWVPERQLHILADIDNHSKFFQLALDDAAGLMAWALIQKAKGYANPEKLEDVKDEFNKAFPLDPLTAKRKGVTIEPEWQKPSPKQPEPW